jgi:hypothetical protein
MRPETITKGLHPMTMKELAERVVMIAALSLTGACQPAHHRFALEPEKEADLTCYWSAERYAAEPDVKAALGDGFLSDSECSAVVMPYVEASNNRALVEARRDAVQAARASQEPTQ